MIAIYVYALPSKPVPSVDKRALRYNFQLAGNDISGDCTLAAALNAEVVWHGGDWKGFPKTSWVVNEYETTTGWQNLGMSMDTLISVWKGGIAGTAVRGDAKITFNKSRIETAIWRRGAVFYQGNVPEMLPGNVWTTWNAPAEPNNLHMYLMVGYNGSAVLMESWGETFWVSWQWAAENVDMVYVVDK